MSTKNSVLGKLLGLYLGVNALAATATLNGTATNGTTAQPSAGDEVILKSIADGITEVGRGKTDGHGRFQFRVTPKKAPYLVSVIHQGVSYQSLAQSDAKPVAVRVYDAAAELNGVTATQDVQRMQTDGDRLQVIEEVAVFNASQPPRTLANERALEIQLPPEAEVVGGRILQAGWGPVTHKPAAGGEKGRYYFRFPIGPGETRFVVAYQLPYRSEATIEPRILFPLQQLVIMLPESMSFKAKSPGMFQPVAGRPGTYLQKMAAVKPGMSLAFRISGAGQLQPSTSGRSHYHTAPGATQRRGQTPAAPASPARMLDNHRWFLSGGLALLLAAIGALFVHRRKPFHLGLRGIALLAACLAAAPTRAATIKGSARNLTTGKPSVGDEVILLTASQPVLELMRTKTGVAGQFSFNVGGIQTPLQLCVVHQGIGHYNPAQPGIVPVDVQVYDVAKELNGVSLAWDVQRYQTDGDSLRVEELILVRNASNPPRTLMNDRPFEIQLPPEARVDSAIVRANGIRTLGVKPVVSTRPGRYFFPYPLRPGETRFAVVYHLLYRREATLQPELLYPVEQFGVVVPKSMKFEGKSRVLFRPVPETPGVYAQATGALKPGDRLAFRISGRGTLPKVGDEAQAPPGGGTAPKGSPAKEPGLLRDNRWLVPGLAGVVLAAAVLLAYLRKRRRPAGAMLARAD